MKIKKIINISREDNINNVISSLKTKGYYKFKSFLTSDAIQETDKIITNYSTKKIKNFSNDFDPGAINITALHLKDELE